MQVSEISYELSIRLGDPVKPDVASSDGLVFSGNQRLRYISRAYSKLSRMLKILMRDYQPEYNKRRNVMALDIANPGGKSLISSVALNNNVEIDEVYVTYVHDGDIKIVPAGYMEPSSYLSNKYNVNNIKSTSFAEGKIKYTPMITNQKKYLKLLPLSTSKSYYTKVEYLEIPDFRIESWEDEVPITGDYIDLLIDLAAIQGMQDIARVDKAQLIERSISTDWQILGQYGTYMKQTEGVKE